MGYGYFLRHAASRSDSVVSVMAKLLQLAAMASPLYAVAAAGAPSTHVLFVLADDLVRLLVQPDPAG